MVAVEVVKPARAAEVVAIAVAVAAATTTPATAGIQIQR